MSIGGYLCMIAVAVVAVYAMASAAEEKKRFEAARRRLADMPDADLFDLEMKLFGRLYRDYGAIITMKALSEAVAVTYEDACLATERLARSGLVEIVERRASIAVASVASATPPPEPKQRPGRQDQVRITAEGSREYYSRLRQGVVNVDGD